mmetsp:Transcript_22928/g.68159  ORF Transcript_22928/g.68159 Transcript_22928/m.68159 type:complete len:98 (-) Transcript_22928:294-587(-)|eukprot:352498-Chlamydomonas_euryale.AAC.3
MVEGYQVSVEVAPSASTSALGVGATTDAHTYAAARTRARILQAHGWATATVEQDKWAAADEHAKVHLLLDSIRAAVGQGGKGGGDGHQHHGGCGCSH